MGANANLQKAVRDTKAILDALHIQYGPIDEVTINSRAQSRWGRCTYHKATNTYSIEISMRLLTDDVEYKALMDTMIHEFLHAHKDRMCHTGEWKRCANLVNVHYGFNIKRCTSANEKGIADSITKYKYKIVCNYCGCANYYCRETKLVRTIRQTPQLYICSKCGNSNFNVYNL